MLDFSDALKLGTMADIMFSIGGENFLAHKFILYFRSPVFATMFNGPMAPKSENGEKPVIKIDDAKISAEDFKFFLQFLYSDKVDITGDNAFSLLNMGKMYDVQSLVQFCEEFLIDNLNSDNVVTVANSSFVFQDSKIFNESIDFLINKSNVLQSEKQYCQMNVNTLLEILKSNGKISFCHHDDDKNGYCSIFKCLEKHNSITEIELFQMLLNWGKNQCKIKKLRENLANMKEILKPFLPLIRFPTMNIVDLSTIVYPTHLLDNSTFTRTIIAAQNLICGRKDNPSSFSNIKRNFNRVMTTQNP